MAWAESNASIKNFVFSLHTDQGFSNFYQEAVGKVGEALSRIHKKRNYK